MNRRLLITTVIIGALVLVPAFANAGDLEDLKATFAKVQEAWNTLNAEMLAEIIHGDAVAMGVDGLAAGEVNGKDSILQLYTMYFGVFDSYNSRPFNVKFKIVENVGLAYGFMDASYKLKGGSPTNTSTRFMGTYTKVKGKWQAVALHVAPVSLGK